MIEIIIFFVLVTLGYFFGRRAEKKHFNYIYAREALPIYQNVQAFSARFPPLDKPVERAHLVSGSVVVSIDYFKSLAAGLRSILGGRINAYETLIERARREAILRMKEEAIKEGFEQIFNVKIETASISKGEKGGIGSIEVYAYGTGLKYR